MKNYTRKGKVIQTLTAIIANFLMISDGMHYAWSSAVMPTLLSLEGPFEDVTNEDITLLEVIYLIGGLAALPYIMYFPDRFGRKYTILGAAFVNLTSWVLIAAFPNVTVITVSRFFAGITADIGNVSLPMYVAEIADKDIRGCLCGFVYIMISIGIFIVYSVGSILPIPVSALGGVFICFIPIACFVFLPESPYYFLKKNKPIQAEKSLVFLRGGANVEAELHDIKAAVERQEKEEGTFSDLITSKANRKAFILTAIILSWLSVSGAQAVIMNMSTILDGTSSYLSPAYGATLYSVTLLITGIISMLVVDKFGRKRLLIISGFSMGVILTILATFFFLKNICSPITENYDWIPLICVLLYAVALRIGIGFVPLILNGELFPTSVKAKGMTLADGCYLISGILCLYLYRALGDALGMYVPLYIFAGGTIFIALIVCVYLPETKGKTLEEIQLMLLK